MQSLNVLVVGEGKCIKDLKNSKFLNKLYAVSDKEIDGAIIIKFNTFKELAQKRKSLQIDIVLVEEEKWVLEGIADVMKQNYINCFAPTSFWTNLGLSHNYAKKMLEKYEIDTPPVITLPVEFPVIIKGDGILKKGNSLQDIINIRQEFCKNYPELAKTVFLEKYLTSVKQRVVSLFDGKHLITFPKNNINKELLNNYTKKLENMFVYEKADFIGFINSDLIEENNILYNTGFNFGFVKPETEFDILYVCLEALYQKLNEIKTN